MPTETRWLDANSSRPLELCDAGPQASEPCADRFLRREVVIRPTVLVRSGAVALLCALLLAWDVDLLAAHGVAQGDQGFFLTNVGAAIGPFMYLGAKHMFTGYDHLLFLVGVLFFLYRFRDVVTYVSLFTLGHSVTLLVGVLWGVQANPFIVDAIIGLSVVYKAFDNMDGFRRFLGFQPNTKLAVLTFGLFHGFGLATTLQELSLSQEGLVTNMLSFNVGVEIGQILALVGVLIVLNSWRTQKSFLKHAFLTNALLMAGGFMLIGYQLAGSLLNVR